MDKEILEELKKMNILLASIAIKDQDKAKSALLLTNVGYTQNDIAKILGISRKAVEMAIYRSKKK
jgi:DNA-directed RNA polymerase specialized sigma24 family protein